MRAAGAAAAAAAFLLQGTHDTFTRLDLRKRGFTWQPGQYVLINAPSVSRTQWHPVSISNHMPVDGTADPCFTVYLKDMGSGTWSQRVAAAATACNDLGQSLPLRVDGPLGAVGVELRDYSTVIIAAGGIGITPLAALLGSIVERAAAGSLPRLQVMHLVWAVRDIDLVREFLPRVRAAMASFPRLQVAVHVSKLRGGSGMEALSGEELGAPVMHAGRPDIHGIICQHAPVQRAGAAAGAAARGVVLTCGPAPLMRAARVAALASGLDIHAETFEL